MLNPFFDSAKLKYFSKYLKNAKSKMAASGKIKINQYTFMRMQYIKLYVLGDGEFIFNVFIAVLFHIKPLMLILSLNPSLNHRKYTIIQWFSMLTKIAVYINNKTYQAPILSCLLHHALKERMLLLMPNDSIQSLRHNFIINISSWIWSILKTVVLDFVSLKWTL